MCAASNLSDRDRVLDATDLAALIGEHLSLRPQGREMVGLCPFHDDRSPSLAVVTHKGNGFYKCFACGASGNAIDFVMEYLKLDFPSALKMLAARAGVTLSERAERREAPDDREAVALANRLALRFYRRALAGDDAEAARSAIAKREFPEAIVEGFQLGYAPDRRDALQQNLKAAERHARESGSPPPPPLAAFASAGLVRDSRGGGPVDLLRHRLVFPILDEFGRCIAFGGRKLRDEDEPKYLNSPESPLFHKSRSLYGIHAAKRPIIERGTAIVTEGYTDVIACHAAGVTNAVATLGTALTRDHARILRRLCTTVVLLFDGDAAGMRAADRAVEVFMAEPVDVKICTLPDGEDPDEVLRRPGGRAIFDAAIAAAAPALEYLVRRHAREYRGKEGISSRQASLEALLRRLADLGFDRMNGVRRGFVLASLSDLTGLPVREIEPAARRAPPRGDADGRGTGRRRRPAPDRPGRAGPAGAGPRFPRTRQRPRRRRRRAPASAARGGGAVLARRRRPPRPPCGDRGDRRPGPRTVARRDDRRMPLRRGEAAGGRARARRHGARPRRHRGPIAAVRGGHRPGRRPAPRPLPPRRAGAGRLRRRPRPRRPARTRKRPRAAAPPQGARPRRRGRPPRHRPAESPPRDRLGIVPRSSRPLPTLLASAP
jgi:DNA primase